MAGKANRASRRAHLQIAASNGPPAVRDPEKLAEQWSPQPTISRWINTMSAGDFSWDRLDAVRKNAELGLTEDLADLTRRMYASDTQIFSTMFTYVAAVSGSRREVTARTVAPEYAEIAKAQADACSRMLEALPNCERSIRELLDGDFTGWAAQEIMWEPRGDWVWPYALEWLHPDRFRFSQTFTPFLWDRGLAASRATELGLDTANYLDGYGLPLPQGKYLWHTPRMIPNYTMVSGLLMNCMRPWWVKNWCLKFWLSGAEFAGNPRLLGRLGKQSTTDAARQELYDALQRMSADSIGVVSGETTIDILDPKMQGNGGVWESLIKMSNADITKAILGSTLNVEVGDTGGNRSLGESQADMTIAPRWSQSALLVANTIESGLFRPFLELNRHHWGGHVFVPQLTMHIVEDEPEIDELAINAGVVKVDQLLRSRKLPPWGPDKGGDAIVRSIGDGVGAVPQQGDAQGDDTTALPAGAKDPQAALNGAQVSSLMDIVSNVAGGLIPRETGIELITSAFPIDHAKADRIMGPVGRTFFASPDGETPVAPQPAEADAVGGAAPLPFSTARQSRLATLSRSLARPRSNQSATPTPTAPRRLPT